MDYDPNFPELFAKLYDFSLPRELLRGLYHYDHVVLVNNDVVVGAYVRCYNRVGMQCVFHTGSFNMFETQHNFWIGKLHMTNGYITSWYININTQREYIN